MSALQIVSATFAVAVAAALGYFVVNRSYRLPLLMELGMSLIVLGLLAAADSIYALAPCDEGQAAVRWGAVALGLLLVFGSSVYRLMRQSSGPQRRITDIVGKDK